MENEVTKAAFADLIGVNRSRVTQMIAEGKITAPALIGEGRKAKINVELAKAQIKLRTDIGQSLGNGLTTRVHDAAPIPEKIADDAPTNPTGEKAKPATFDDELRRARLEKIQRDNRREEEEERARRGEYVRKDEVKVAMVKLAVEMLNVFDGSVTTLANAIAAKFKLPQRDVVHLLRTEFQAVRSRAATTARQRAVEVPDVIEDGADQPAATPGPASE